MQFQGHRNLQATNHTYDFSTSNDEVKQEVDFRRRDLMRPQTYAAEAMDDSAFGLHLAEEANPREAGLPFYIASAANDVGEALELFARYSRIVNEAMRIKRVRAPEVFVTEITFGDHSRHSAKQVTECSWMADTITSE
jgi:Arabinose-binding domain of AraC transcription regulator, N-term